MEKKLGIKLYESKTTKITKKELGASYCMVTIFDAILKTMDLERSSCDTGF